MTPDLAETEYSTGDDIDGRYELRRDIGTGGAGRVFEAVHRFTGRSVALKLVASGVPFKLRAELRARLMREARSLAALRHPNIVEALDGGVLKDGTPFLVMELLEGRTIEGLIAARGRLGLEDTVGLAIQLADALEVAHAAQVVHRDVKPSNVLVVRDHAGREVIKLVDFGIARVAAAEHEKLTGIGALIGTPAYMSPEQLLALDDVDAQSDVYSLGVTMFECLTGQMPYEGNYQQVLLKVCSSGEVPNVRSLQPDVPAEVAAVIAHAMTRDRGLRIGTVGELRHALQSALLGARRETFFFGAPSAPLAVPPRPPAQQRRLVRAPYVTPVRLVLGDVTIDARTEDISTGGVLMICKQVCPVDQRGSLRFAVPIEGKIIAVDVQVRWVRAARSDDPEGPRAVGLEFVDPPSAMLPPIARYVELMRLDRAET